MAQALCGAAHWQPWCFPYFKHYNFGISTQKLGLEDSFRPVLKTAENLLMMSRLSCRGTWMNRPSKTMLGLLLIFTIHPDTSQSPFKIWRQKQSIGKNRWSAPSFMKLEWWGVLTLKLCCSQLVYSFKEPMMTGVSEYIHQGGIISCNYNIFSFLIFPLIRSLPESIL